MSIPPTKAVVLDAHVRLPPRIAAEPIGPLVPLRAALVAALRDLVVLFPLLLRVLGDVPGRDAADSVASI